MLRRCAWTWVTSSLVVRGIVLTKTPSQNTCQHAGLDLDDDLFAGIASADRADLAGDHDDAVGMH